jgi:hypothetical protein
MMFRGPPPPIIDNPEPEDVLFGRDSESWNHDGNKHFRAIVADYQDDYHSTKLRSRKVEIVARIIEELKQRGARFLKRDRDSVGWYEVDRKQVVEKVRCMVILPLSLHATSSSSKFCMLTSFLRAYPYLCACTICITRSGMLLETSR